MPYASNDDLPPAIRRHLPEHAQDMFREVFNNAWRTYGD
ncbi:MAG TPA: ChaB family protein [Hyphomicrobiaceae bacterium]|nr:ChaB family protein [Hyphomicrobiaceae bacterium]